MGGLGHADLATIPPGTPVSDCCERGPSLRQLYSSRSVPHASWTKVRLADATTLTGIHANKRVHTSKNINLGAIIRCPSDRARKNDGKNLIEIVAALGQAEKYQDWHPRWALRQGAPACDLPNGWTRYVCFSAVYFVLLLSLTVYCKNLPGQC